MSELKIAFLQLTPGGSLENNLNIGLDACRRARDLGAHIALFPEMWSNGYDIYSRPPEVWKNDAIPADSPYADAFRELAGELSMAIGITLLESCPTGPRNTFILFDRRGKTALKYSKIHTCDFDVERNLTPGDSFFTAALDTHLGQVQVGAMICFDREYPESARILMLQGAELILVPNACPMEINRLSQLRSRAFENMTAIATCNYPSTVPDCNGGSSLFDGIAWVESSPHDMQLFLAGGDPGIYIASLDIDRLREYRLTEPFGGTYRHPRKYSILLSEEIRSPFIREDYRP